MNTRSSGAFVWWIAAAIGAGISLQCGFSPLAGVPGGETNTRVQGKVVDSAGIVAPNVRVQLVSSLYDPLTQTGTPVFPSDTTDESGIYEIDEVSPGNYTLEAFDLQKLTRALIGNIAVRGGNLTVYQAVLQNPGTLKVMLPAGVDPITGYVFFPGTTVGASLNGDSRSVTIDAIPAGAMPPLLYGDRNNPNESWVLRDSINVPPGEIVTVEYAGWRGMKKLALNTTPSGADVAGTVTDFPVLVRLTNETFPFSQARSDGSDLRFAKPDGTPLPFEIESWDSLAQTAAIWVRLDTVYGSDRSRYFMLYWGNPKTAAAVQNIPVFDTTSGFQGVWHLADNSVTSTVADATGRNDGMMKSGSGAINTSSTSIDGIAGGAVQLRGRSILHWIDLGADKTFLSGKSEVSISVWMNADSDTSDTNTLIDISKGGKLAYGDPESRVCISIRSNKIVFSGWATDDSGQVEAEGARTFVPNKWYHIVGVMKAPRDSMYLFVNGELWGTASAAFGAATTSSTNSTGSAIGADNAGKDGFFYGKIDEVRIEDQARTPDWIKLSYMNQKETDALIK